MNTKNERSRVSNSISNQLYWFYLFSTLNTTVVWRISQFVFVIFEHNSFVFLWSLNLIRLIDHSHQSNKDLILCYYARHSGVQNQISPSGTIATCIRFWTKTIYSINYNDHNYYWRQEQDSTAWIKLKMSTVHHRSHQAINCFRGPSYSTLRIIG